MIKQGDPGYEENRKIFNAMIDRKPSVIAQCEDAHDVAEAIRYARANELEIAVRGGGHGVAGMALTDGGLVIDLRKMNQVEVDSQSRTVKLGGGATMKDLDRGTQPFGLGTTGGRVSTTGVGGLTLGGGGGWLDRKFGLVCDNLVEAEIVTADGRAVKASETENPELFWALHGGGGNFGVATSLTLRVHPLTTVHIALMLWPADQAQEMLTRFRDFFDNGASNNVGGGAIYLTGPPEEFVPAHLQGKLTAGTLLISADGPDEIEPMTRFGHEGGMAMELPYADLQSMLDDPPGMRNYWSAEYLTGLPDEAVRSFVGSSETMLVPSASQNAVFPQGGAVGDGPGNYPVPWRSAPWAVHPFGMWENATDDERGRSWVKGVNTAMRPWSTGNVYLNFIGDEGDVRVKSGFGAENYQRLQEIKREFDPLNVFHLNHNIKPA